MCYVVTIILTRKVAVDSRDLASRCRMRAAWELRCCFWADSPRCVPSRGEKEAFEAARNPDSISETLNPARGPFCTVVGTTIIAYSLDRGRLCISNYSQMT